MSKLLASAAVIALIAASGTTSYAQKQKEKGSGAFCLQQGTSGNLDCSYSTMEQCKKAATGSTDTCTPREAGGKKGGKKSN
jgi:hypothetical protein